MLEIRTPFPDLMLRQLTRHDAPELHRLLQRNRDHLTAHGDYREQVSASLQAIEAELNDLKAGQLRFGIFLRGELVGRADLNPVDPPRFGIGYWLAEAATGKGHATIAISGLIDFAREEAGARDVYAGVTHGNARSVALLERLGFRRIASFDSYDRFHRSLDERSRSSS